MNLVPPHFSLKEWIPNKKAIDPNSPFKVSRKVRNFTSLDDFQHLCNENDLIK